MSDLQPLTLNFIESLHAASSKKVSYKKRRAARLMATQCLYAWEMNNRSNAQQIFIDYEEFHVREQKEIIIDLPYAKALFFGAIEDQNYLDSLIVEYSSYYWEQLDVIETAILRYSTFELIYNINLDAPIIINEAVEIAKDIGAQGSYSFVNKYLEIIKSSIRARNVLNFEELKAEQEVQNKKNLIKQINDIDL